jgi:hypothetical protein
MRSRYLNIAVYWNIALPVILGLATCLVWPVQGASYKDPLTRTKITSDNDIASVGRGAHPRAFQTEGLRLAFDQTTLPKKGKKRKGRVGAVPGAPAETGIMENNARYLRSQRGQTTTGVQIKPPTTPQTSTIQRAMAPPTPAPTPTTIEACTSSICSASRPSGAITQAPPTQAPVPPPGQPSGTAP